MLEVSTELDTQYGCKHCMGILKEGSDEESKIVLSATSEGEFEGWVTRLASCNIAGICRG